jgi:putative transposase
MKKSRFTDKQIIHFLKQAESGVPVKELCRKHGFSDATFYKWRGRLGGLDVAEARRLRELEGENSKLKKLLAEAMLDIETPDSRITGGAACWRLEPVGRSWPSPCLACKDTSEAWSPRRGAGTPR